MVQVSLLLCLMVTELLVSVSVTVHPVFMQLPQGASCDAPAVEP